MMDYFEKEYDELISEEKDLTNKYNQISDECAKKGVSYEEFCEKAHDIKESLYFIEKYKRQKQTPTVQFGSNWKGKLYTLENFKQDCLNHALNDNQGYGRYGTSNSLSDIKIYPSDILENIYRTDFSHIIWLD